MAILQGTGLIVSVLGVVIFCIAYTILRGINTAPEPVDAHQLRLSRTATTVTIVGLTLAALGALAWVLARLMSTIGW